jgi:selenide,water dikinase
MLNRVGAELAEKNLVQAGTDVTGFGLLGHLANICRGSNVAAEIEADAVPAIDSEVLRLIAKECIPGGSRQNLKTADALTDWNSSNTTTRHLLTDAQTSGGLLLCVAPKHLDATLKILRRFQTPCSAVIGRVVKSPKPEIRILGTVNGNGFARKAIRQRGSWKRRSSGPTIARFVTNRNGHS